jgi:uncharacterized protein
LFVSVLALWLPSKKNKMLWPLTLALSLILGLIAHQLDVFALIPLILLYFSLRYGETMQQPKRLSIIAKMIALILSVGLCMHLFPGFHNLKVLDHIYFSPDAIPFSLYLNIDKTVVGIFILGMSASLICSAEEWLKLFKQLIPKITIVLISVISLALLLKFVRFNPKLPLYFFIWSISNLFLVCMAEEALFRGFIQKNLSLLLEKFKYADLIAILLASLLFGLMHFHGDLHYVLLATAAGIGYGWVYVSTKRIEGSIFTHFIVNMTHFLFFTYPALAANS